MKFELCNIDLHQSFEKLKRVHERFTSHFRSKTRSVAKQSFQYLQGLLLKRGRGNMTTYARNVPDCNNQSLQHFISDSPWDERPVIDHIQSDVVGLIGDEINGAIHIDESAFPKQGMDSVGVKRQYCGRLGKVENCQVGVFLGYTNKTYRTLIDEALYLPKEWVTDQKRRKKCGVPDEIGFNTKAELGWNMIQHAEENGIPFGWIGMDCHYGEQPWLLDKIDINNMIYIADVPRDTRVWLNCPKTEIPNRKGDCGRFPIKEKLIQGEPDPLMVYKIEESLKEFRWNRIFLRDTERKELWCEMACLRVYPVRDELPGEEVWLIIRRDEDKKRTKYQLSNAPLETSIERLGQMSCSRYWIERAFEDAKGIAGLADYQIRTWTGWHHHITITLLAMLVILMLNMDMKKKAPLLTVQDVKEILEVILPKRKITDTDLLNHIKEKHKARYSARKSHHRRNK